MYVISSDTGCDYQKMMRFQRLRHIRGGYPWPGKSLLAYAETKYPNILAELDASRLWLNRMADLADVSPEIMAAVMEDGEELSEIEIQRLAQRLVLRWMDVSPGYLSSPILQLVDPHTNKGKLRRKMLTDLMNQADGLKVDFIWDVEQVCDALGNGKPVTFAAYSWAIRRLKDAIRKHGRAKHKPRSTRRKKDNSTR